MLYKVHTAKLKEVLVQPFPTRRRHMKFPMEEEKKNRKRKHSANLPHTVCAPSRLSLSYLCPPLRQTTPRQVQINTGFSEISVLRLENQAAKQPSFPAQWIGQILLIPPLRTVKETHPLSKGWIAGKILLPIPTCSIDTYPNQRELVSNKYMQTLMQQSSFFVDERNSHSLAEAWRNNRTQMGTEDIWLGDVQRWSNNTLGLLLNADKEENPWKNPIYRRSDSWGWLNEIPIKTMDQLLHQRLVRLYHIGIHSGQFLLLH